MARIKRYVFTPSTVDVDGIAAAQAITANTAMTLNGAESSGGVWTNTSSCLVNGQAGKIGHQIAIDCSGDINAAIFTIVGLDPEGRAITETITGVTTTPVESTKYYHKITSITPDTTSAETVWVGAVDECITSMYPISARAVDQYTLAVDITGTINYDVEYTFQDHNNTTSTQSLAWNNHSEIVNETTSQNSYIEAMATAVRFVANSYTGGATVQFTIIPNAF